MSVRAASDPAVKAFQNTRCRVVRVLCDELGGNTALARQHEAAVYARAHSSPELYMDTCVGFLRRHRAGSEPWPCAPVNNASSSDGENRSRRVAVSNADLSAMFKIEWGDIINEEARFALAQCPKCRSREIYTTTAQLRSADEGMSVLATCERCGEQWTQH